MTGAVGWGGVNCLLRLISSHAWSPLSPSSTRVATVEILREVKLPDPFFQVRLRSRDRMRFAPVPERATLARDDEEKEEEEEDSDEEEEDEQDDYDLESMAQQLEKEVMDQ